MSQQQRAALGVLRALRSAAAAASTSSAPASLSFATKAAAAAPPPSTAPAPAPQKDWSAVAVPPQSAKPPTTVGGGQAYAGDLRSTSGLCAGDGITAHTSKWLQGAGPGTKSPMEWVREAEPIEVHADVVASTGSEDPALGCPVEYINLKGTTREAPAVCKYTGNRYFRSPSTPKGGH